MMQEEVAAIAPDPLAAIKTPNLSLVEDSSAAEHLGGLVEKIFFRTGGQTSAAVHTDGLFLLIFWFSVFFFLLLMALMVYWVIKYRRRPGVPAEPSPSHNGPLEILWTVVPSSAMIIMFIFGFDGYMQKVVAPTNAIELKVTGAKWDWKIEYPDGQQTTYRTSLGTKVDGVKIFVIPEDTPIKLVMTSNDVIHAFWVPDYRTKMDLYPNRFSTYTFHTEKLGPDELFRDHWIFCAEYCGDSHSEMYGVFRVVPRSVYDDVLADWNAGSMSPVEMGEMLYRSNCISCHSTDGSPNLGPTWKNLFGYERALSGGGTALADENYILESVWFPTKKIAAGFEGQAMTNFSGLLDQDQISAIIAYMKTLSDKGGVPEPDAETDSEGDAGTSDQTTQDSTGG
jgi:cytochrome c oxidase subunit II